MTSKRSSEARAGVTRVGATPAAEPAARDEGGYEGGDDFGFGPLLAAWDLAHAAPAPAPAHVPAPAPVPASVPSPVADADWRHLLDEMAHPGTTRAFHRLAEAENAA